MMTNQFRAYLERAREIIGDRTQGEADYDDAVVAFLNRGLNIKGAFAAANQKYPSEALFPGDGDWADMDARYQYIREHKNILKSLGLEE